MGALFIIVVRLGFLYYKEGAFNSLLAKSRTQKSEVHAQL